MAQSNPYVSNNGLRVTSRTSQSISLAWPSSKDLRLAKDQFIKGICTENPTDDIGSDAGENKDEQEFWNSDGNWVDVQIRKDQESSVWSSIYKGYGCHCKIDGLPPDSVSVFRMKRNQELEWGSEVVASTDPSPASTEDLNRAVEMNSDYLITRILELTRPTHLKNILTARDRNGMTTLMVACHSGNVSIAERIISAGSDINAFSSHTRRTPLMFACIAGHENVVAMLDKHKVDWTIRDKSGCNSMDYAINGGHLSLVKLGYAHLEPQSIHGTDLYGWTPLMRASIMSDNLDVLHFLIGKGADPNGVDKSNTKSVLMSAILAKKPKFVRFLLDQGANPFYENQSGKSCLKVARGLELREITEMIKKMCDKIQTEK